MIRVGVLSDTHGLLRPQALAALSGSELLIHAGDIGKPEILERLHQVAPVHAVRGNVDRGAWVEALAASAVVEVGRASLYVLHDLAELDVDPVAACFSAVIYGHSHEPRIENRRGVLYLNPGSCGPRRFRLPVTVARIVIEADGTATAEIVELDV